MSFPNIFSKEITDETIARIKKIKADTKPEWGKMNAGQMMAHCCVPYETVYTDKHPRPNAFSRFLIKLLAKSTIVGTKPYQKNGRTAPHFVISGDRDFEKEKNRLVDYIRKTQELGYDHFHNKESHSIGKLTGEEWNALFFKHLDHHLRQFGV